MKVSVLGAGAVGCMITGLMKKHDPSIDLWLYARGDHALQMRRTGKMELLGPWGFHKSTSATGFGLLWMRTLPKRKSHSVHRTVAALCSRAGEPYTVGQ